MDLGLTGRVAIVTGASRGIGFACAAELAAEGAHVVAISREPVRNEAASDALVAQAKGRVMGAPVDLNDAVALHAVFARALAEFGRLDILVNCAAVIGRGDFFSLGDPKWARIFDDKLNSTARCIRFAELPMRQRKWGRIINVLGGAARQPQPNAVAVGLNNAAILNLTKALASGLAKDNILINAVIPSVVASERLDETIKAEAKRLDRPEAEIRAQRIARIPLGRMGEGREVGAVVAFLASERASFVTGSAWNVDGGAAAVI